ncbi:MAG: hypothetical protein JWM28_4408 [Chitinophagaceae bacterium]|nr:hypothetical protein [Chitinophagaceae bacterium]
MKKILLTMALSLTVGFSVLFAQSSKNVDSYLLDSFKDHFTNAKDVNWKQAKGYTEVTFTIDYHQLTVFYDGNAEPFAVSRNISSDQLPLALLNGIKRNYNHYWISDLFEVSKGGRSAYYVTLENADNKKILKSGDSGQWMAYHPAGKTTLIK